MSVEQFFKLKEIDSLTKMKNNYLTRKKEQDNRVSALNERRQEKVLQTTKLKQDLISSTQELGDLEAKIKSHAEQKQRLIDIGGDEKKIALFSDEISQLESKGLELLEKMEVIEQDMTDVKTFLTGLEKTISEIEGEVSLEVEKIRTELSNIEMRINLLMEELPSDFKALLLKITAKNLAHGPFTRIENGSCYFCRFKISRIDESEIDMQKNLKTCPQCSRIFLPYGA